MEFLSYIVQSIIDYCEIKLIIELKKMFMKNLFAAVVMTALLLVGACDTTEVVYPVTVTLDKNNVSEMGLASS